MGSSVLGVCVCLCEYEDMRCSSSIVSLAPRHAFPNRSRPTISCNIYPVTWDYFPANGSEKDFPRATYDRTRHLEYFMSEYCNDLFELWELLEEMPAELEVCPPWSHRAENELFALHKETVDAELGQSMAEECRWTWRTSYYCMVKSLCFGLLPSWSSISFPIPNSRLCVKFLIFLKVWESERFKRGFP